MCGGVTRDEQGAILRPSEIGLGTWSANPTRTNELEAS
jgi:hypothetical protein